MTLAEHHIKSLAQFEGQKYCSIEDAARYLHIGYSTMRAFLTERKIKSKYIGRKRKVIVASLLEFDENLPIDPPRGAR